MKSLRFSPSRPTARPCPGGTLAVAAVALGVLLTAAKAEAGMPSFPAAACAVQVVRNVAYRRDDGADARRHLLDLYLPRGKKNFPVIVLVHGGAWVLGDKSFFGWGTDLGTYYAGQGIGVVMPSYRLSPAVKNPDQVKDVAGAVAWTYRNIARFGGNPEQLFLCGHSAGGQLVSLLAADAAYLKAEGLKSVIKGVVSVSGVYRIPVLNVNLGVLKQVQDTGLLTTLTGAGGSSTKEKGAAPEATSGGFDFTLNPFRAVFGNDPRVLSRASPITHVRPGLPPFLVIYSDHDLPLLPQMALDFAAALRKARDDVQLLKVARRDHETVMFWATRDDDPVAQAIQKFVARYSARPAK